MRRLVVVAVCLLAGCGTPAQDQQPTGLAKTEELGQAAVRYAQCLRDHGYQAPDPTFDQEGLPVFGVIPGLVKGPEFDEVQQECAEPLTAAMRAAGVPDKKKIDPEQLLAFARCMRENGVEIPDPTTEEPLAIPKAAFGSPSWQQATEACGHELPESWRAILEGPQGKPGSK